MTRASSPRRPGASTEALGTGSRRPSTSNHFSTQQWISISTVRTTSRVLHDLGGAIWLGGSLMGAVGLNGASAHVQDPFDRLPVATAGWARWVPVSGAAMGAHLLGGLGVVLTNRDRAAAKTDVEVSTVAKLALTAVATGATIWSSVLGAALAAALEEDAPVPAVTGVIPAERTPAVIAAAQQRLRGLQWLIPTVMAVVLALSAQRGEQQYAYATTAASRPQRGLRRGLRRSN